MITQLNAEKYQNSRVWIVPSHEQQFHNFITRIVFLEIVCYLAYFSNNFFFYDCQNNCKNKLFSHLKVVKITGGHSYYFYKLSELLFWLYIILNSLRLKYFDKQAVIRYLRNIFKSSQFPYK